MFNVWDRIEENVFADDDDPPRFLARTPHGYHDTALTRSELEDAGFSHGNTVALQRFGGSFVLVMPHTGP